MTPPMRQPRLAEMIAGVLRDRIVNGELDDDATLPTLDRLVDEFGVSAPSVREALRILETEGLITVRRGKVGGAAVHSPKAESAAYMLGLVLQNRNVAVGDLAGALGELLISCACACARRTDRAKNVVPHLRRAHKRTVAMLHESGQRFERMSKAFHQELVDRSGNRSLSLTFTVLDWLWSAQEEAWATRVVHDESPDLELRRLGIDEHEAIVEAIASGDVERTGELTRRHVEQPEVLGVAHRGKRRVQATALQHGSARLGLRAVGYDR